VIDVLLNSTSCIFVQAWLSFAERNTFSFITTQRHPLESFKVTPEEIFWATQRKKNCTQWKKNLLFGECYNCFSFETKTGAARPFVIFQDRPVISHINRNLSRKPDLLNDVAEHRCVLEKLPKNAQPPFWFHSFNRFRNPQNGVSIFTVHNNTNFDIFLCWSFKHRIDWKNINNYN